jgi:hypothetical protein
VSIITTNAAGQTTVTLEPYETLAKNAGQLLIVERPPHPNIDHLITEDDTPVDTFFSAGNNVCWSSHSTHHGKVAILRSSCASQITRQASRSTIARVGC